MTNQKELFPDQTLAASHAPASGAPRRSNGGKWQRESATRWIVRQTQEATERTTESRNMSHHHHHQPGRNQGSMPHDPHTPAWMRLHHDWRFWFAVVLMFACMIIYVLSEDLAWGPVIRSNTAPPSASGQP